MGDSEPTFVRRQLGVRLKRLRESAGKTQSDVQALKLAARQTIWRIEEGRTVTNWMLVEKLCQLYGADDAMTEALVELSKAAKGKGWFEPYGDVIPQRLQLYLGCELGANSINIYDPAVIAGQLQTPDYAREIFTGESTARIDWDVDRLVEARLERQQRFWTSRPRGAVLCVALDEAALRRRVGERATMGRQLAELRRIGDLDGVDIRVLHSTAGAHPAIYGGYTIFEFPERDDPTVVYAESYTGGRYLEEAEDVARMLKIQQRILDMSIPIKEYASPWQERPSGSRRASPAVLAAAPSFGASMTGAPR